MCNFATLVFALQHADNTLYNRALDLADHWDASGEKDTVHFISPLPQTPITPKARRRKKVYPTVPVRTYFPFPSASGIALYAEWCESCHRCGSRSLKITKKTVASPPLHGCLSHSCARVRERVCVCERDVQRRAWTEITLPPGEEEKRWRRGNPGVWRAPYSWIHTHSLRREGALRNTVRQYRGEQRIEENN